MVTGETGDDAGNKQVAEYYLAISLYRLKFYQASYAIFSVVADNPNHLKFNETLLWLAKLATQLPEPADIIERVGKYTDEQVRALRQRTAARPLLAAQLHAGPLASTVTASTTESIRLFQRVDRNSECYYVKAQFFTGISYVQLRKSGAGGQGVPARRQARSTKASRASRTRIVCATSRSSRWRARSTRRPSRSTQRPTRRTSTSRSCPPR